MTINDIVNMDTSDLMRLSKNELNQVLKDVNRATSRRTRDLRKSRKTRQSPAYRGLQESGGTINTSDQQTINQMRKEFFRGQKFLKAKTSTVTGTKKYIKKMQSITGQASIDKNAQFWDIFYKFNQMYPALFEALGSDRVARVIKRVVSEGRGLQDVINEATHIYNSTFDNLNSVDWSNPEDDTDVDDYDGYF